MSINFSAFDIGRRALNANQVGIDITGQNISNVNTPGYSRRGLRLVEATNDPHGRMVNGGVSVAGVFSFRNIFIESRIQRETGVTGRLSAQRDTLSGVETALQGSENGGIHAAMANFFGAFRDLESDPNSLALRSVAVQRGAALANAFQTTRARLDTIRRGADEQLRRTVDEVNGLADSVARLNAQIRSTEAAGGEASALRDQRDTAVNRLAELAGIRSSVDDDGTVSLTIGDGRALVTADKSFALTATSTGPSGLATMSLEGQPASFLDGVIAGLRSSIDDIGNQLNDLDALAASVAARVNALHTSGTDQAGNAGLNFFTSAAGPITAANISVNAAIAADSRLVVASPLTTPGATGTVAGQIANLLTDTSSTVGTRTGSFSAIFSSMVAEAGARVSTADANLQTQAAILAQATAQRDAVAGVSLDEEAINLLQYQRAFDAATKFIKIADEMTQMILSIAG